MLHWKCASCLNWQLCSNDNINLLSSFNSLVAILFALRFACFFFLRTVFSEYFNVADNCCLTVSKGFWFFFFFWSGNKNWWWQLCAYMFLVCACWRCHTFFFSFDLNTYPFGSLKPKWLLHFRDKCYTLNPSKVAIELEKSFAYSKYKINERIGKKNWINVQFFLSKWFFRGS